MGNRPTEVRHDLTPRLEAAASAVSDAQEALQLRREQRDKLVVQAADEGMQLRAIARAAGVSTTRVVAILADSQPDLGDLVAS